MLGFDAVASALDGARADAGQKIVCGKESLELTGEFFSQVNAGAGPRLAFVDAGSGVLLAGAGAVVGFVRTYGCLYGSRRERMFDERFVVVVARGERKLEASLLRTDGQLTNNLVFDAYDPLLALGGRRARPETVLGVVRKWLEFAMVERLVNRVGEGGVVVRDGDLDFEGELLTDVRKGIERLALQSRVIVFGVSKTSALLTDTGRSATEVLMQKGPRQPWCFDAKKSVCFLKLHERSRYVFRCDVLGERSLFGAGVSALAENARDPVFLGYPYGLLDADRMAQVTREEEGQLALQFAVKTRERFGQLARSQSAHGILDGL
ncbi:hypothetical protein C4580_01695 [Candidatus Woesearchaeota archaeon]|nr:MAG: hypothetical protein C4580_01695 [Candidatus Woesearchaeota archaeon]